MNEAYVIVTGTPVDGFEHIGPFDSRRSAENYVAKYFDLFEDYWVILLQEPAPE